MNQIAALYVGRRAEDDEGDGDLARRVMGMRAQMVACRVYAAARGFFVRDAYAAGPTQEQWTRNTCKLLERVQVNPALAVEERLHVLVLYDWDALGAAGGAAASGEDALAQLLRLGGVRVEAVQPPHVVAEAGGPCDLAWQEFARTMFSGAPVVQEARSKPIPPPEPIPVGDAVWLSFLALLNDEQRLRRAVAAQQEEAGQELPVRMERLDDARRQEWMSAWRMGELLDLLLDRKISQEEFATHVRSLETELQERRLARRRAHAALALSRPSPELVDRVVLTAVHISRALEGLQRAERQRAAGLFQIRSEPTPDGPAISCLLPLVDDRERESVVWSGKRVQGRDELALAVPPRGGSGADPEDFLLQWRLAAAATGAGAETSTKAALALVGQGGSA